ncbi:MAG: carbohydrate ABC transporter permease [Hungatella sp.]|nr:carbohydrate ABC transporter permease [Hungatella sp.]
MNRRKKITIFTVVRLAFIGIICTFSLFPVLWCLSTSLKTESEIYRLPPSWIPEIVTLKHYKEILGRSDMMHYFVNTVILSTGTTLITMVVSVLAAYGFSRYKFTGSRCLICTILFARVLPRVSVIIPYYIILKEMKLLNTYQGLMLVYLTICLPVAVWMLKGYFDNLPVEVEEAAVVDGCSPFGGLVKIVIPMCKPILATVAMNAFILSWNEFLFALTMTDGKAMRPIAVGLAFFIDEMGVHWGELMAASMLMSVPAVIFFSLAQNQMVRGLSAGAVKG